MSPSGINSANIYRAGRDVDEVEDGEYAIPTTMDEALTLFEAAHDLHEVLGQEFCEVYGEVKREEMRLFHREISPWEREHLLLNV